MIVQQPQSQTVVAGSSPTFSVVASSVTSLSYQWRFNGGNISGATRSNYAINNVQPGNAGTYSVVVQNVKGFVPSADATLTVLVPPTITTQPQSQTVDPGATVTFSVTATGTAPLSYHWQFNGVNISGATASTYAITNVYTWNAGNYSVAATNVAGGVTSLNATLTVNIPSGKVFAWGQSSAQTNVPADLTNVLAVSAGGYYCLALKPDGTVSAWGLNVPGWAAPPAGLKNVIAIAAGNYFSVALKADKTVVAWGTQSGTNVPTGLTNVASIAAGDNHGLAVSNGYVIAWGQNVWGQTNVPAGLSNVVAVAAGVYHSVALKSDGTGAAWGRNDKGQGVWPSDLNNVVAIAAGDYFNVALRRDGTVRAWGDNSAGQTRVPPISVGAVAVAGGSIQAMALTNLSGIVPWGSTLYGLANVPAGLTNAIAIDAGANYNVAIEGNGWPAITVQPVSQTIYPRTTVSFTVLAVGKPTLAYQWRSNGTPIPGATNYTYTRANVSQADAGSYSVVITNSVGRVTSASATLTVRGSTPPVILSSPGFTTNGFAFRVLGPPGTCVIQASTNLANWVPVATNSTFTGLWDYMDSSASVVGRCFYRALVQ